AMDIDNQLNSSKLALRTDLEFAKGVLKCCKVNAEPDVRGYLLDHVYTMARDQLLAAHCFTRFARKPSIDDEDLRIASTDKADDLKFVPTMPQVKPPLGQHSSAAPSPAMGLLLPPWRNCQVGVNAQLKQLEHKTETSESIEKAAMPPNKMPKLGPNYPKNN
ncbi:hypothetical protein KR044_009658, partial [Drosophila immigrans]